MKIPLLALDDDALRALARAQGQPAFRGGQLAAWLHDRRVDALASMTNLPAAWRTRLDDTHAARTLTPRQHRVSDDALTEKWLFDAPLTDGSPDRPEGAKPCIPPSAPVGADADETNTRSPSSATREGAEALKQTVGVETVLIRERRGRRRTVCVSCMAGCPLGCVFCATGRGGFDRHLAAHEMIEQVYRADAAARAPTSPSACARPDDGCFAPLEFDAEDGPDPDDDDHDDSGFDDSGSGRDADSHADGEAEGTVAAGGLTHAVFMGMGEPLLNLEAVLAAAKRMTDPSGLGFSARRITISTVGIPEGLRRLTEADARYRLAWSLHAPDQDLRASIMPAARRWPLDEVVPAIRRFAASASRVLMVEYTLIAGVNDGAAEARGVARLMRGWRGRINLIAYNPVDGYAGRAPTPARVRAFAEWLRAEGLPVTVRVAKGAAIGAACGQLRAARTPPPSDER